MNTDRYEILAQRGQDWARLVASLRRIEAELNGRDAGVFGSSRSLIREVAAAEVQQVAAHARPSARPAPAAAAFSAWGTLLVGPMLPGSSFPREPGLTGAAKRFLRMPARRTELPPARTFGEAALGQCLDAPGDPPKQELFVI